VATQLDYRFVDTDAVIEKVTVDYPIICTFGRRSFGSWKVRCWHKFVLYNLRSQLVAALRRENWSYLHHGLVVWLDVPVELLYARLTNDTTHHY